MKLIKTTWRYSRHEVYQITEDELPEPTIITLVGIFVKEGKHYVVIARDKIRDEWRSVMAIPNENIIKRETILPLDK